MAEEATEEPEATPEEAAVKTKKEIKEESYELFKTIDADKGGRLDKDELENYISSQDNLWSMLSSSFSIPVEECQQVATRVAMELATGRKGEKALSKKIDKRQFHDFRLKYIEDPKGSQEFFHRCIFALFDADGDGELAEDELDKLLDALYKTDDFFTTGKNPQLGEIELPPRQQFKTQLFRDCDRDGDGKFSLSEIRKYLSKLERRGEKSKKKKASDESDLAAAAVRAEAEANLVKQTEKRKAEEKAKEEEGCIFFDWVCDLVEQAQKHVAQMTGQQAS